MAAAEKLRKLSVASLIALAAARDTALQELTMSCAYDPKHNSILEGGGCLSRAALKMRRRSALCAWRSSNSLYLTAPEEARRQAFAAASRADAAPYAKSKRASRCRSQLIVSKEQSKKARPMADEYRLKCSKIFES